MGDPIQLEAGGIAFAIEGLAGGFTVSASPKPGPAEGIVDFAFSFAAREATRPAKTTVKWREPMRNIHFKWNPACYQARFLDVTTGCRNSFRARSIDAPPVVCLHDISGTNALTFAFSDTMHLTEPGISVGEDGFVTCSAKLFCEPWDPTTEHSMTIRMDRRRIPYNECLGDVAAWWDELIGNAPPPVPEGARVPLYSTWYSYHGQVTAADVERECGLARELGMRALIVDAGWSDGEFQPKEEKFPDFAGHVQRVQAMGIRYLVWTTPSALNPTIEKRFKDKVVTGPMSGKKRLDPRYPDVREYIIAKYERCLEKYGVDGFKVDFVSSIASAPDDDPDDARRDYKHVSVAGDRLFRDLASRLRELKPDVLIEYRQSYVGPHMQRCANMFRAVDCGNSFSDNRIRTIDIRLLLRHGAAHSDMMIWNPDDPVESAAMQLTHTMFSVPQVSVRLADLPRDHTDMLRYYLKFWSENRDVLLDGRLAPLGPESAFAVVLSRTDGKMLAAVYGNAVLPLPSRLPPVLLVVNATYSDHVVVDMAEDVGARRLEVVTCTGQRSHESEVNLTAGVNRIDVPPSGYATLRQV
ncbi:MAG: glycoside hydrolase family 36 protein [Planctomycetota bacterium]